MRLNFKLMRTKGSIFYFTSASDMQTVSAAWILEAMLNMESSRGDRGANMALWPLTRPERDLKLED